MAAREFDVILVGGGVAGLSTAWHLGRLGIGGVVLLEREALLGQHSSALNAAILRTVTSDPVLTALARAGADFLRAPPPGFADVPLVDPCGLLIPVESERTLQALAQEAEHAGHTDARAVGAAEIDALTPHVAPIPPGARERLALLLPSEGRLDIAAEMGGFERGARRAGIELRTGAAVAELLTRSGRVRGVRLAGGEELRAERVVLAAGGWAGRLGQRAGSRVALEPTRRHLLVTAPDPRVDPRWPVVWAHGQPFYCRPESGGLMISACDQVPVDPDACVVDPAVREAIAASTARFLPRFADARVAHFWCGMRTMTSDGRFAVGPDPDVAGLFWVAGLGGHGMVAGAELGRLAAVLLTAGPEREPLAAALDPARLVATTV